MHEIHTRVSDVGLPAIVTCPTTTEDVERDLADETNDLGFVGLNRFQCAFDARPLLTFFKFCHVFRGPIHQVYKIQCVFRNEFILIDVLEQFVVFEIAFNFIQQPRPGEQIPEHLVV